MQSAPGPRSCALWLADCIRRSDRMGLRPALQALAEPVAGARHAPMRHDRPDGRIGRIGRVLRRVRGPDQRDEGHADASHVNVTVQWRNSILALQVRDDGSGGASIDAGSGLRGLADRVAALDGRLLLDSPSGKRHAGARRATVRITTVESEPRLPRAVAVACAESPLPKARLSRGRSGSPSSARPGTRPAVARCPAPAQEQVS